MVRQAPQNPAAFPTVSRSFSEEKTISHEIEGGMKLRDYFAAAIVSGTLANPTCGGDGPEIVRNAYLTADAMLAEREKGRRS